MMLTHAPPPRPPHHTAPPTATSTMDGAVGVATNVDKAAALFRNRVVTNVAAGDRGGGGGGGRYLFLKGGELRFGM